MWLATGQSERRTAYGPSLVLVHPSCVTILMRLAADSHQEIEGFHRHFGGDEELRLPPIHLHNGRWARWVTRTFRIGAITFGRHVLVNPTLTTQDLEGKWTAPAWLVAHETTHVLQYEEAGYLRFLSTYLRDYWRCLRRQHKWNAAARQAAYHNIQAEQVAREAEGAYAAWKESRDGS